MRPRRRGGAGVPCDGLRPPIPDAPSNEKSDVGTETTPRVAYRGNAGRTVGARHDERRRCPCCGHDSYIRTRKPGHDGPLIVLHHCHFCRAGLDEIAAESGLPRSRLNEWGDPLGELGPIISRHGSHRSAQAEDPPSEGYIAGAIEHLWSQG